MEKLLVESKTKQARVSLPKISDKTAAQIGKGWYYDNYSQSFMPDWEVVVTPDGASTVDYDFYTWTVDDNGDYVSVGGYTHDQNSSGGGDSGDSYYDADDFSMQNQSLGIEAVEEFGHDLESGEVIAFEHNSNDDAVLQSVSLALMSKGAAHSIISALKADAGLIGSIGRITSGLGGAVSGVQFVIGVSDGEVSAADIATGVGAVLGIAAIFVSAPVTLGILGAASVFIGIGTATGFIPGDQGTSGGY